MNESPNVICLAPSIPEFLVTNLITVMDTIQAFLSTLSSPLTGDQLLTAATSCFPLGWITTIMRVGHNPPNRYANSVTITPFARPL